MKLHDNTLYITTQGIYVSQERQTLLVRLKEQTLTRFPIHTLGGLVCFGNVAISPFALGLCAESGVCITWLTERGRFLARMEGPVSGNVLLRRRQYRIADDDNAAAAEIARAIVAAKVANARGVLLRTLRDRPEMPGRVAVDRAIDDMALSLRSLQEPMPLDAVRGVEGEAANHYFGAFDHLITAEKPAFTFNGRSRRPPKDNVNALLSFIYVLLTHDMRSACEAVGLDSQVGFLHRDRPGRPSLALDLVEEFRAVLGDRLALSLINRRQVNADGFETTASGAVEMNDKTRKTVLVAYQERKQEEITHPFLNEQVTVGLLPHIQAQLLARHLRGDIAAYPSLFWK